MTPATRLRLANAVTLAAVLLLAVQIYGMLQRPRPAWTTGLVVPALALLIAGRGLRRRTRREP